MHSAGVVRAQAQNLLKRLPNVLRAVRRVCHQPPRIGVIRVIREDGSEHAHRLLALTKLDVLVCLL
jgi:hypothetical protein